MEAWGRAFGGLDLCHIGGVVEFAVGEDELEGGKMIEGEGRVFGEEEEVGAFADLDGADIVLKPDVLGTVEGGGAQDLEGACSRLGRVLSFPSDSRVLGVVRVRRGGTNPPACVIFRAEAATRS
jgi:hypothetical protein